MTAQLLRLAGLSLIASLGCAGSEPPPRATVPSRFAAVGQEPGWLLDIDSAAIRFSYDYAQRTVSVSTPEPTLDATGAQVWHVQTDTTDLRILVRNISCEDVMSGKPYPATVTVTLNGQVYRGCGGPPDSSAAPGIRP